MDKYIKGKRQTISISAVPSDWIKLLREKEVNISAYIVDALEAKLIKDKLIKG